MARKAKLKIIQAALETTYGTDAITATPAAAVSIRGHDFNLSDPLTGEDIDLAYDDGELGSKGIVLAGNHVKVTFKVYVTGSGLAAKPAAFAPLLLGCLLGQTIGANVTHAIDAQSDKSLTLHFWQDGVQHAITGARGTFKLSLAAKQLGSLEFSYTGLYTPVVDQVKPPVDWTAWRRPKPVGVEHSTAAFDAQAVKIISCEFDYGAVVEYVEYIGHQEVQIGDVKPKCTLVFEAPKLAKFNPFAMALAEDEHQFSITHGAAGDQFQFIADRYQMGRPKYTEQNGILTYTVEGTPLGESVKFITA